MSTDFDEHFLDVLLAIAYYNDGNPSYLTQVNSALSLCAGIASFAARRRLDPLVVVMEKKQETQLSLTNLRDAFIGHSRSPNIVQFHKYVRYNFLLCNCNFVFKTRRFYYIPLQKCRDLEIRVRGYSRSKVV